MQPVGPRQLLLLLQLMMMMKMFSRIAHMTWSVTSALTHDVAVHTVTDLAHA